MVAILTIVFAIILFLLIMDKCYFVHSSVSIGIIIIVSLMVGYILASLLLYLLDIAFRIGVIVAIIILLLMLLKKDKKE